MDTDSTRRTAPNIPYSSLFMLLIVLLLSAAACQSTPPVNPGLVAITALPTYDPYDIDRLCSTLNSSWGSDWPRVIATLEKLHEDQAQCNGEDPALKLYPAYYNYGAALESQGDTTGAVKAYQNALSVNPQGKEVVIALKKYNIFTPMPLSTCSELEIKTALAGVPPYTPQGQGGFAKVDSGKLSVGNVVFHVRGVNYYPVRAPWKRFLLETDLTQAAQELDLIHDTGFNTLRIFLIYDTLFQCPGNGTVPKPQSFAKLDGILNLAIARGFHVLITLNDSPDLTVRPLYLYPEVAAAQTAYIVERYRAEPAVLAWDLRNEGDIDYTRSGFDSNVVLNWLKQTAAAVRQIDGNHLLTAGWLNDAQVTDSAVDFLSFHHWSGQQSLLARIAVMRIYTQKPLLLEETGLSTFGVGEEAQSTMLHELISAIEHGGYAGWIVWTAFDFPAEVTCTPPACPGHENGENHFGLWHTDYTPKPAVAMLKELVKSLDHP
ncbi:MAG: cellulase family glycosylhydrolase [Chloroflexota bacterium]